MVNKIRHIHFHRVLLLALAATCAPVGVQAVEVRHAVANSEEMLYADDPKDWARPKVVVTPKFPDDQLKLNASGRVDVEVVLDTQGEVKNYRIVKSEPPNPAFEKAVDDVVRLWLFHVKQDKECVPVESTGNARVWFEVQDGKGKVSVSGQVSPMVADGGANAIANGNATQPRKSDMLNYKEVMSSLRYPAEARRADVSASLTAVARVDGVSGQPADVTFPWLHTSPGPARASIVNAIQGEVKQAVMRAKFAPREGGNYRVCLPFEFRVSKVKP